MCPKTGPPYVPQTGPHLCHKVRLFGNSHTPKMTKSLGWPNWVDPVPVAFERLPVCSKSWTVFFNYPKKHAWGSFGMGKRKNSMWSQWIPSFQLWINVIFGHMVMRKKIQPNARDFESLIRDFHWKLELSVKLLRAKRKCGLCVRGGKQQIFAV